MSPPRRRARREMRSGCPPRRVTGSNCCATSCSSRQAGRRPARARSWRVRAISMHLVARPDTWPPPVNRQHSLSCSPRSCGWHRLPCRKSPANLLPMTCWVRSSASSALASERTRMLTWRNISDELRGHRSSLLQSNVVALLAVAALVPLLLLLPLLVYEVLLHDS